ncbi:MAG: membrane protein insertase YidC [Alphaproteobacteria bacterium]|nr:membrane protein insertase YidC [Alphaproteobacteria bacterium]
MTFNNNEPTSSKNFIIAMVCFMVIMVGYDYFTSTNSSSETQQQTEDTEETQSSEKSETISVKDAMSSNTRVKLENTHITGTIDLNGGVIDSVILKKYKQTTDENSENVMLLTPKNTANQFYYAISYIDKDGKDSVSDKANWKLIEKNQNIIKMETKAQNGLVIERTVSIDDKYLWKIKDKIANLTSQNVRLSARSELVRTKPEQHNYAVVHEGLVGYFDNKVDEIKYKDIDAHKSLKDCKWIGYTDLYWLCSIVNKSKNVTVSYDKVDDDTYKIITKKRGNIELAPSETAEMTYSIFTGAKDYAVLKDYRDKAHLDKFEMAIDFGWFFIITKPLIQLVDIFADIFSNMGIVILVLTLLFRIITYPLMKKSFVSMAKMREIQPKIAMLQRTYANDKMRMNQEMMMLYRKEKVSPMSGCLPMLLQAPIFFCLYKIFFISIEMRHAPLFGWIKDLSAPDNLYLFNLFGLIDWTPPSFLQIGLCPIIMGLTMFFQQKLSSTGKMQSANKTSEQKMQENMMLFMPLLFTYICASFPVAVVIYWTISNIFSIIQQQVVTRRLYAKE